MVTLRPLTKVWSNNHDSLPTRKMCTSNGTLCIKSKFSVLGNLQLPR